MTGYASCKGNVLQAQCLLPFIFLTSDSKEIPGEAALMKLAEGIERIVRAMRKARDLAVLGELPEGYEVSIDGVRLYVGRHFSPSLEQGNTVGKFGSLAPILPQIVSFKVLSVPPEKRPTLSIICAMSLEDIMKTSYRPELLKRSGPLNGSDLSKEPGKRPNSGLAVDLNMLEIALEEHGISIDAYRFTELNFVVLSLPIARDYS